MSIIFVSYSRHSEGIARSLVNDLDQLGRMVWFDQDLTGGQAWWDQILAKVRECDVFIFVLDQKSLSSVACKQEYLYAADLGKSILPILVADGISANLLPPQLSQIQFVDYRKQDRNAVLRLARALAGIPPPKPLPDPLPVTPEVPLSYLGRVGAQIDANANLNYESQSALVVDLRRSLRDPETCEDTYVLLKSLRKRRDLFAAIAEEVDELIGSIGKAPPAGAIADRELSPEGPPSDTLIAEEPHGKALEVKAEQHPLRPVDEPLLEAITEVGEQPPKALIAEPQAAPQALAQMNRKPTSRERLLGAVGGAVFGTILPLTAMLIYFGFSGVVEKNLHLVVLLSGAGWSISGAIIGTNRNGIVAVLIGGVSVWFLQGLFLGYDDRSSSVGVLFAPVGAILGAIAQQLLRYQLSKRSRL